MRRKKRQNETPPVETPTIPIMYQIVQKRVPAVIHWSTVEGTVRTDDEVIGEAIIYEDGSSDVIIFGDISPEAKRLVGVINQRLEVAEVVD